MTLPLNPLKGTLDFEGNLLGRFEGEHDTKYRMMTTENILHDQHSHEQEKVKDGMFYGATGWTFKNARELRLRTTMGEQTLWTRLQKKQIDGFRFRRQHPIGIYIADFYCHQARLVIEVDGGIHSTDEQIKRDAERTIELNARGITVLRFTNSQVEFQLEEVIEIIKNTLINPPPGDLPKSP